MKRLRLVHPELGAQSARIALILGGLTWLPLFEMIRKMRVLPVAPADFIAMVLPGLIPALPLAATVMPVGEILKDLLTGGLTVAAVGAA